MTLDIQWAVDHLATKDDVSRIEETIREHRGMTEALRKTLDQDIAHRLLKTEQRVTELEVFRHAQAEERRDHLRRAEDRRRQRVTWAVTLVGPLLVLVAWGWKGITALFDALWGQ